MRKDPTYLTYIHSRKLERYSDARLAALHQDLCMDGDPPAWFDDQSWTIGKDKPRARCELKEHIVWLLGLRQMIRLKKLAKGERT